MHDSIQPDRVVIRAAIALDREPIYRLRHPVYACILLVSRRNELGDRLIRIAAKSAEQNQAHGFEIVENRNRVNEEQKDMW